MTTTGPIPTRTLRQLYNDLRDTHDTTRRDQILDAILDHPDHKPTQDPTP